MARLLLALVALAAIIAAAYLAGRLVERHHAAADWRTARAELDALDAALVAIPADAIEHRQEVAAHHRAHRRAAVERLDTYYLDMRSPA
ncbi:hypothetical protein OG989_04250 [Micromonospora sp. NBC_01740]|uniref:hypothetical protein n=1 Tax=Micromonospora sp. NBC_01740 TaxID=2975986 RepID=UPI002E13125E|nr:hypothetical protein OG989_04250 [Micromonospora sp. NBC_01740]